MRNKKLIALMIILTSVTLLVVLNSVIFSVQNVSAYCPNGGDTEIDRQLETFGTNGLRRGQSIILLDTKKVISHIESQSEFAGIKVYNIERKFPNRIVISYERILPYLIFTTEDGERLYLTHDLKILTVYAAAEVAEGADELIELKTASKPTGKAVGDYLFATDSEAYASVARTTTVLNRFTNSTVLFEMVDASRTGAFGQTYYRMRTGVYLKIFNTDDQFLEVLHRAVSLHHEHDAYRSRGMIIAGPGTDVWEYSDDQDYDPSRADYKSP